MTANRLYFGDCLDVMRRDVKNESVDLIYADPPPSIPSESTMPLSAAPSGWPSMIRGDGPRPSRTSMTWQGSPASATRWKDCGPF